MMPPKPKPAKKRGGRRAGAGRKKSKATLLKDQAEQLAADMIGAELPGLIANLIKLANGGYQRVEDRYEPAGCVLVDDWITEDGKSRRIRRQAFPNVPPDQPVLVSRIISTADSDRQACVYLIDRILGRPHEQVKQVGTTATQVNVNVISDAERLVAEARARWIQQIRENETPSVPLALSTPAISSMASVT